MELIIGIILIVAAVFLVVAVLLQSGKAHNLSGAIAGGAETFFGKSKGKAIDKKLSTATTIVAILFVVLVVLVYVFQESSVTDPNKYLNNYLNDNDYLSTVTTAAETTAEEDVADTTAEDADTTAEDVDTTAEDADTTAGDVDTTAEEADITESVED